MIVQLLRKKANLIRLIQSEGFRKYFNNTSWLLADNVLTLAIGLMVSIFVARYLGAEDFGLLNFAKSIAKFFSIFCALGFERIVIRNLVKEKNSHPTILGTAWRLKTFTAIILLLLFALTGHLILDQETFFITLFLIAVPLFESFTVIRYYFASRVEARFVSRVVLFKIIICSGIKILMIVFKLPVIYFAAEILFESVIATIGYVWIYKRKTSTSFSEWKFDWVYAKRLLINSWPVLISGFVIFIYTETDIIMIKYMLGNEEVGHYAIAVRLTTIWYLGGTVICNSLLPAILNAKTIDEHLYQKRLLNLLRLLIVMALGIAIFITLFGKIIITTFLGPAYIQAIPPLMVLTWSLIFVYFGVAGTQWYIAENLQQYMLIRSLSGAVVNIILNIIFIPQFGIVGSALATLIAQVTASFFANVFTLQTRPLFWIQVRALTFIKL